MRPLLALTLKATAAIDSIAEHYLRLALGFILLKKIFPYTWNDSSLPAVQSINW